MKNKLLFLAVVVSVLCFTPLLFARGIEEEAELLGWLWSYAHDQQALKNPDYLAPLLGNAPFSYAQGRKAVQKTGLFDSRPAIRSQTAELIYQFAGKEQSAQLAELLSARAKVETDPAAKGALLLAAVKLKYKFAEAALRPDLISQFMADAAAKRDFSSEALEFCLREAEDEGIASALPAIDALRSKVPEAAQAALKRLDEAKRIINLRAKYPGESLFAAVLSNEIAMEPWITRVLFKQNSAYTQKYANQFLLKLLADKDGDRMVTFKRRMEDNGVLRSENLNPGFEFFANGLPGGWQVSPPGRVCLAPDNEAKSYLKSIAVNNPDEASQASIITQPAVEFNDRLPAAVEFGLSYKMACPQGCYALFNEQGMSFVCAGKEEPQPQGKASIRLEAEVTLNDGARETASALTENPYALGYWDELRQSYKAPAGKAIKSVKLTVLAQGKPAIYLDDVYLRRSDGDFMIAPPRVTGINAPELALAGEYVLLSAEAAGPQGLAANIRWSSNLEGELGEGRQITACFSRAGEHTLFVTARNEFGIEDFLTAEMKVVLPVVSLTAGTQTPRAPYSVVTPGPRGTSIGGRNLVIEQLAISLTVKGIEGCADKLLLNTYLYANGALVSSQGKASWVYMLDTTFLPNGINKLFAKAAVRRKAGTAVRAFSSPLLYVFVDNGNWCKIPQIISPQAGAKISGTAQLKVSFTSPQLPAFVKYFLSRAGGDTLFVCQAREAPDYPGKLVAGNYSSGEYQLTAVAYYSSGGGEYKTARSAPIKAFIEGREVK